jgi:hypothetical protein
MNVHDWEAELDPFVLLDHLFPVRGLDSVERQTRQSRLYLLACVRRSWDKLHPVSHPMVEIAERMIDGEPLEPGLRLAVQSVAELLVHGRGEADQIAEIEVKSAALGLKTPTEGRANSDSDPSTWSSRAHLVYFLFAKLTPIYTRISKPFHCVELIREIFGNPFRPVHFHKDWLDSNVVGIAKCMDATRDFSMMPMLADALQDSGCENPAILDHCHLTKEHVRGCWVLESILHKPEKT